MKRAMIELLNLVPVLIGLSFTIAGILLYVSNPIEGFQEIGLGLFAVIIGAICIIDGENLSGCGGRVNG